MAFADRVHEARREAGLTTLQLSERTGIAYTTLRRRLLSTPEQFTLDEIDRIAEATGAPFEWIVIGPAWYERAAS